MNYFAHGRQFVDQPYLLAGTAVPDWLNVSDRGVRVRSRHAAPYLEADDERLSALARGITRHHADDAWFHETAAFAELSWRLTADIRRLAPTDESFRASFLGHILVELLLDAVLISEAPEQLDRYYQALAGLDGSFVQTAVNRMSPGQSEWLGQLVERFVSEQFLWDYAEDAKLCFRLNQVLRRVKLPPLPDGFAGLLPDARRLVAERRHELLLSPSQA